MRRMFRAAAVSLTPGICCATLTPPAAHAANWTVTKPGEVSENVRSVQFLLNHHGLPAAPDASYGADTQAKVAAFQRARGLGADGVVGPRTWAQLAVTVRMGVNAPHAVNALKSQLSKLGARPQILDGAFSQKTHDEVRWIQASHGLAADGVVGPDTWSFLLNPNSNTPGPGGAYRLPLDRNAVPRSEYDDPHHDYPAIDIGVPTGTRVYAIHAGQAVVTRSSDCGNGVRIVADDGGTYSYCHFVRPGLVNGRVHAGQLIGYSGSTGRSFSPHLHVQIRRTGEKARRCPQPLLLAIYDGRPVPAIRSLPLGGCTK